MVELQQPCLGEGHGGGVTYDHLFDPAGNWLGVAGSYSIIMQGGRPLVVYNSAETWFHHVNNIGSRTFMTNHYGTPTQDMVFYPWGGLWQSWGGGGLEFADLPYRDTTTNTDLTENRLFSPNLSRWHSPDPLAGSITNPQSLNRYAYVLNNPTSLTDPMGLGICPNANPAGTNGQGQTIYTTCNPQQNAQSNLSGLGGSIYSSGLGIANPNEFVLLEMATTPKYYNVTYEYVQPSEVTSTVNGVTGLGQYTPGYWLLTDVQAIYNGSSFLSLLQRAGNFSSGAADVLTLSGTYWVQRAMGTNSVVNRSSGTYYAGAVAGSVLAAVIGEEALSENPVQLKIALHDAHHSFDALGELSHIQLNWWRAGVPGSGGVFRIPLPWGP